MKIPMNSSASKLALAGLAVASGSSFGMLAHTRAEPADPAPSLPVLFFDDFEADTLDAKRWVVPPLRPTELPVYEAKGGKLLVHYNTYSLDSPGVAPTHMPIMGTAARFGPGAVGGNQELAFEARMRLPEAAPGLNGAFFVYESEKESPDPQDEIDIELLTNAPDKIWMNTFNGLKSGVLGKWVSPAEGFDMREWNTYAFHWKPGKSVKWFVNGHAVRPLLAFNTPDEAMGVNLTYWKPGKNWREAYHPFLDEKGTKNPAENTRYTMEVDWVRVRALSASP